MTHDDITRLAERVEAISTGLTEAERRVKTAGIAADLRTLAKQQSAANLVPGVMHCAKCKFRLHRVTLYMGDGTTGAGDSKTEPCPNGCGPLWPVTWEQEAREAMALANSMHEQLQTAQQQGNAGGVAVYEVQERMSSFAPSSRWTETTREAYEGGYFPETLFHRRILYATPPTHIPDAGNMVSANPPEAGVTEGPIKVAATVRLYAGDVFVAEVSDPELFSAVMATILRQHPAYLSGPIAPQPKDAT